MNLKKILNEHFVGILLLIGVVAGLYLGLSGRGSNQTSAETEADNPVGERVVLAVGGVEVMVEVRDEEEERALGLSGRESLGEDEGMLFIYESAVLPTFWMKDMKFDLDIVWIREGLVLGVSENIPAPTKENLRVRTAGPNQEIDMVLEVPSGFVKRNGVQVGDKINLLGN